MRMAKRLVCLPLGASPLLLSMYPKPGSTRFAVTEGLDAEAAAVGPGPGAGAPQCSSRPSLQPRLGQPQDVKERERW